jgi:hypothetical protein
MNITDDNVLDPEAVAKKEPITSDDIKELRDNMKATKEEVYKTALKRAWADKHITQDEKAILDDLKLVLKISETEHRQLEDQALRELQLSDYLAIYETAMEEALKDGIITDDEYAILENLRKKFKISEKTQKELEQALHSTAEPGKTDKGKKK